MPSQSRRSGAPPRRGVTGRRAPYWVRVSALGAGLACSAAPGEGRSLGTDLGTFSVEAARGSNECGPSAVGNPQRFSFDVELARDAGALVWAGRTGTLDSSLDFELTASVRVELRAARGADAGCSIAREDLIFGELAEDETGAITSLAGEMHFTFSATRDSTCTLEEQDDAELPRLPCRMIYALSGRRTRAPIP